MGTGCRVLPGYDIVALFLDGKTFGDDEMVIALGVRLKHYQNFGLFDMWAEIAKLPSIRTGAASESVRATGTDDAGCESRRGDIALPLALRTVLHRAKRSATGRMGATTSHAETSENDCNNSVSERSGHYRRRDSNPRPPDPQRVHPAWKPHAVRP